jgi:hypothetical protein
MLNQVRALGVVSFYAREGAKGSSNVKDMLFQIVNRASL